MLSMKDFPTLLIKHIRCSVTYYNDEICKYYVCPQCHLLNNPKTYPLKADGHIQCRNVDCAAFLTKAIQTSKSHIKYKVISMCVIIPFHKTFANNIIISL